MGEEVLARHTRSRSEVVASRGDAERELFQLAGAWADWVILDGYQFDERCLREVASLRAATLVLDDHAHLGEYPVDLLMNQNLGVDASLYGGKVSLGTQLLLGPEYVLLREQFRGSGDFAEREEDTPRVLVSAGGGDQRGFISKVIEGLNEVESDLQVHILAGPSVEEAFNRSVRCAHLVSWLRGIRDMRALMSSVDLAVTAGGSTCWELARVGCPMVVVPIVENQRGIAAAVANAGLGWSPGWHEDVSPGAIGACVRDALGDAPLRAAMAVKGSRLVDGDGVSRVWSRLKEGRVGS
jgi:spore coat polysaccharide biosynthesis predicted glycosyltransferase SpsG